MQENEKRIKAFLNNFENSREGLRESRPAFFEYFLDFSLSALKKDESNGEEGLKNTEVSLLKKYTCGKLLLSMERLVRESGAGNDWVDIPGEIYMSQKMHDSSFGQFFTPKPICDLMARLSADYRCAAGQKLPSVYDPTCGSGRTLLAANSLYVREYNAVPYLFGADIDSVCVKMTALNLVLHGCLGQVVCMDSLLGPASFRFGYVINETLLKTSRPSARYSTDPEDFCFINQYVNQKPAV